MQSSKATKLLEQLTQSLELPDSAYEKAVNRYEDLGAWFDRVGSRLQHNNPHISPQGSFRLGTAIKPINENESYDLDLTCNIRSGFTTSTHTQQQFKKIVGDEIEAYRVAKRITAEKEEKHRCWRLEYADNVSFHLDIVPCIPESQTNVAKLTTLIENRGLNREVALNLSSFAVCITDNSRPNYSMITDDWQLSNPEGYAKWFEYRMSTRTLSETSFIKAQVDEVPLFKRKTTLQKVIQLLKRHRDVMFAKAPNSKPISIIITTLATEAYSGITSLEQTLTEVINALVDFANANSQQVLNPVNPKENFADKWTNKEYEDLFLQKNFYYWVHQVKRDFDQIIASDNGLRISEIALDKFAVNKSANNWSDLLDLPPSPSILISTPKNIEHVEAKPWSRE